MSECTPNKAHDQAWASRMANRHMTRSKEHVARMSPQSHSTMRQLMAYYAALERDQRYYFRRDGLNNNYRLPSVRMNSHIGDNFTSTEYRRERQLKWELDELLECRRHCRSMNAAPSDYDFVEDAMYALEKDCSQTAEVLRRRMPKQKPPPKPMEVEYKLRFTPPPPEFNNAPFEQGDFISISLPETWFLFGSDSHSISLF